MRIALISGSLGDGKCGVGDYTYELAQHLSLDAEVHVYFDRRHKPLVEPFGRLETLHIHPLGGFSLAGVYSLTGHLAKEGYEIVHVQYPSKGFGNAVGPGYIPQRLAGMQSTCMPVVTLHEWTTSHPLRKMVMDQMLPTAEALVVTNEQEMQVLVKKLKGQQITAIPVGNVLTSRRELENVWLRHEGRAIPPPKPPAIGSRDRLSLFHYGLPAKGKGLGRLLDAIKLVRQAGVEAELCLGGDFSSGKLAEDVLNRITELDLSGCVRRLGHIPSANLAAEAEQCMLAVFPFDEGFSSKRSSIATISELDIPIVVGGSSTEEHPYYAPEQNNAASLAVLLTDLLTGKAAEEWAAQVSRQREYAKRFSFGRIAQAHMGLYKDLVKRYA